MAASIAWMALVNNGKIKRGDKVLINGGVAESVIMPYR